MRAGGTISGHNFSTLVRFGPAVAVLTILGDGVTSVGARACVMHLLSARSSLRQEPDDDG